jgi:hypothetical protein
MVQSDPVIELSDYLKKVFQAHHDAFLVELLGVEGSGLSEDVIEFLLEGGYLQPPQLEGVFIPGSKYKIDPYGFTLQIASAMNAVPSEERAEMTQWPLSKWVSHIDDRIDAREEEDEEELAPLEQPVKLVTKPATAQNTSPAPLIVRPPDHVDRQFREAWIEARTRAGEYARGLGTVLDAEARAIAEEVWTGEQIIAGSGSRSGGSTRREEIRVLTAEAVAEGWDVQRKLANGSSQKKPKTTQEIGIGLREHGIAGSLSTTA